MKYLYLLLILFSKLANASYGLPDAPETGSMYHDHFYLGMSYDLPNLEFYDNPEFKSKPVMVLNDKGLFFKEKLVCKRELKKFPLDLFRHRDGKRYKKGEKNYHSTLNVLDQCDESPIKKDQKFDWPEQIQYYVEVYSQNKNVIATEYNGTKLYLNLDSFKHGEWMKMRDSFEKVATSSIKWLLKEPYYIKFVKGVRSCLEKKDPKCLSGFILDDINNEEVTGDFVVKRFGQGYIDPANLNLGLNKNCDGTMPTAISFAECITTNPILIDQLKKCLDQKTFDDFYKENPNGRKLKCEFNMNKESTLKIYGFYSAEFRSQPPQGM